MAKLPLTEIQALVLRNWKPGFARHFVLRLHDAASARQFMADLHPSCTGPGPKISMTDPWDEAGPEYSLGIGITYAGMEALEAPPTCLAAFPYEFRLGPHHPYI